VKVSFALVAAVCFTAPQVLGQEIPDTNEVSVKDELEQLKAVVAGMQESATEQYGYVDFLRKIKISGYVQAQFRLTDLPGAPANFSGGAFPTYSNKVFQVRRGRIKVNYDNVLTQAVLQMDFVPSGFTLKDAFLSITEPWLQSVGLQIGVFDRPFGYEISFSSGWRETPERSRIFQTLFPGERDLGAKLFFAPQLGNLTWLRADVGIFNGSGANTSEFDNFKDFIGRVAVQMPFDDIGAELDLGISGYLGHVRNNTKFLWQSGVGQSGERGFFVDSTITNLGSGVRRKYFGLDAQFYYDVTNIGGLTLRGEFISGHQPGIAGSTTSTISPSTQPTGALYRRNFNGWYLSLVQNIGNEHQVLLKYDVYDPNTDVGAGDFSSTNNLTAADIKFGTLGLGYVYHWDGNVKFVLYYEFVNNEKLLATKVAGNPALAVFSDNVRDNVFTFRVQYRFPN
jgi:hypothetical protein